MMNFNNLCMNCMNPLFPNDTRCSKCGYDRAATQAEPCLALRTVLKQNYIVGTVTAKSNAVITYNGYDSAAGKRIYIHEYFPSKLAARGADGKQVIAGQEHSVLYYECLNSFDALWKSMMTLRMYDALETPYDVFYLNNTVYCVTDFKQCITLRQYLDSNGQLMTWKQAGEAFSPVLDALSALHEAGHLHGGINISTVLIGADNKIHLTMPPVSQSAGSACGVEPVLQDGYAPIECYDAHYPIGAETDIYSVMAVMYVAMTGVSPQKATERAHSDTMIIPHSLASGMTPQAIETLIKSMKVYPEDRFHSVSQLKNSINASLKSSQSAVAGGDRSANVSAVQTEASVPTAAFVPVRENRTDSKTSGQNEKDSGTSLIIKAVISALVIGFVVFSTMYTTYLYKSIRVPALDKLYSPLSFLPINQENDHGPTAAPTTTVQPTVAPSTAAPTVTVPPTVAPTTTTEPPTTPAPTTTEPPTTPAPTTTEPTAAAIKPGEGVEVADFTVLTYSDIRANAVFNKNFTFEYQFESSETYEKNAVISQSIPAGETVAKGTKIVLVISTGPEKIELPDVIGMDYEQARMTLEKAGFRVKKQIRENDGSETPGKVYMMSLVAGLEFEKGTEVTLVVWGERPNR